MRLREAEASDSIYAKLPEVFRGPLVSIVYLAVFAVNRLLVLGICVQDVISVVFYRNIITMPCHFTLERTSALHCHVTDISRHF